MVKFLFGTIDLKRWGDQTFGNAKVELCLTFHLKFDQFLPPVPGSYKVDV